MTPEEAKSLRKGNVVLVWCVVEKVSEAGYLYVRPEEWPDGDADWVHCSRVQLTRADPQPSDKIKEAGE